MTRESVYKIIDGERDYQGDLWNHQDSFNSVGDFITYMDVYLIKAKQAYTEKEGAEPALDVLRKVVTLGIACFEIHGVPQRK